MLHKKIKDILILEKNGKGNYSDVYKGVMEGDEKK